MCTRTICNILKFDLHHSYKKAAVTFYDVKRSDIERNRGWFKFVFGEFYKAGCRFIWIDEVNFNPRHAAPYSWVSLGYPPEAVHSFDPSPNSTAICALTDEGMNMCQMRVGINKSAHFVRFLEKMEAFLRDEVHPGVDFKTGKTNFELYR